MKVKQDGLIFVLNKAQKIAKVVGHLSVRDIIIPRSINCKNQEFIVKSILKSAFEDSMKLNSIQFPPDSEVSEIESYAFSRSSIKTITIPPHVTKISEFTFNMCKRLQKVDVSPNSELQVIEKEAFNCSSIESITIPATVYDLKDGWCNSTPKLKNIILMPNNPYFMYFDSKMIVGKSDKKSKIYDFLVFVRRDIKKVIIPSFIKMIGPFSFCNSSIENIIIPSQVTHICRSAFRYCNKLTKVEFNENSELQIIHDHAFADSTIENISIPQHVTKICELAFSNCDFIEKVELSINSQIEIIEKNVFSNSSIKSLTIPSSISQFQEGWCNSINNLTEITILKNKKENIKLFNNEMILGKTDLNSDIFDVLVFVKRDLKTVKIPSFIKIIGSSSFNNCLIDDVFIPSQIKKICHNAFNMCKNLKKIDFSPYSELVEIESGTFNSTPIKCISIPSSVAHIGKNAFYYCFDLKLIEVFDNSHKILIYNDLSLIGFNNLSDSIILIPFK